MPKLAMDRWQDFPGTPHRWFFRGDGSAVTA
jgi:hypothetical protein